MVEEFDVIIIGSGFGGSVSAHRLSQKGYSVAVLEAGKRWNTDDFPNSNWRVWRWLWAPLFKCFGIMQMHFFRRITILSGAGVGGGSLVYANTLLVPPREVFDAEKWGQAEGWWERLSPFYDEAKHMLGVTRVVHQGPADNLLGQYAKFIDRQGFFTQTDVAVFMGQPNVTVPDPYFDGEGPERSGCNFCGGCMTGCQYNAKNTLDKNYLYFAEKQGARVFEKTKVTDIVALGTQGSDGYEVLAQDSTSWLGRNKKKYRAKKLILSAGVMGTLPLLMKLKQSGAPISDALGETVRTNSEAILGATGAPGTDGFSEGVAIGSSLYVSEDTHIEAVRYASGDNAISLLTTLLTNGGGSVPRFLKYLFNIMLHPVLFARTLGKSKWSDRTIILLVMQTLDNSISMRMKRLFGFGPRRLTPVAGKGDIPTYIPEGNKAAAWMAEQMNGVATSSIPEVLMDAPTTAHILGGACMGSDPATSVIGPDNAVHGMQNLYVIDGAMISANLGVNPSLTISALAEHAISQFPDQSKRA